ncbi:MAG: tRNA (N(6)-L-threonylcarbamoyladenosine(37)-C(2))-methylthiotransferase MtaB [Vicingaceae bacterium]
MNPGLKFTVHTLGCKLNFAESSWLANQLQDAGYASVTFGEPTDILVLNTCSVTENANKKCRSVIQRARRKNPELFTIVMGCYAQLKPSEISMIPGVNMVIGASEKFNLLEHLENGVPEMNRVFGGPIKDVKEFKPSYSSGDRTRTFLKVQDGCDYFCTFCTIPLARGLSRSSSIDQCVEQVKEVVDKGVKEVVLTGVNIGDFGTGTSENFLALIEQLDELEGIDRYRISSIEPNLLTDDIIDFVANSRRFMPHFHIPLQSGSDRILKAMKRKYDKSLFKERVDRIRSQMPMAGVGIDVITGFPGETEEDFQETFDLVAQLGASYLHVFTYSERANTKAIRLTDSVDMAVRRDRSRRLQELSRKLKRNFYLTNQGQRASVLFEKSENGYLEGFTDNYIRTIIPGKSDLENCIIDVKLASLDGQDRMVAIKEEKLETISA